MKRKSIAFLLVSCLFLGLLSESPLCVKKVNAQESVIQDKHMGKKGSPNGLQVAWDINWDEDLPSLAEGATYQGTDEEMWADILWDAVWSIKNGDDIVSADSLHVYKWNEGTETYEAAGDSVVTVEANGADGELVQFSFAKCGRYHVSLDADKQNHKEAGEDTEGDGCITVSVGYPDVAFYRTENVTEEGIIKENPIRYQAGDTWYVHTRPIDSTRTTNVSFELQGGTPDVLFDIQTIEKDKTYKITANASIEEDASMLITYQASDVASDGDTWSGDYWQNFTSEAAEKKEGLLATNWMYWDDDLGKDVPSNELEGFSNAVYTTLEDKLCFKYNDGTMLETDEEGKVWLQSEPLLAEDIKIYITGSDGKLTEASKDIVSYKQDEKSPEFVDFSFKECGSYLVSYTPTGKEESRIVIYVQYPTAAFYTGAECTENGLIRSEKKYTKNNRTFYYVIHQYESSNEGGETDMWPKVVQAPNIQTNGKAAVEKQSDTVYKITVNAGVTEDVTIVADGGKVKWEEDAEEEDLPYCELSLRYEETPVSPSPTNAPGGGGENNPPAKKTPVAQKNVKAADGSKVTTKKNGTAVVTTVAVKKKAKSVKVPSTVVVNGVKYTVTTVGSNAFKKVANTVTGITLPSTITKIEKNAFKGLKKLKKITLKGKTQVSVAKGAFKGTNTKKVKIIINKKMKKKVLKKCKADLKKAGFKGSVKTK